MSGGVVSMRDGTPYRLLTVNGVAVVSGCATAACASSAGAASAARRCCALASWDDHRSVAS